MLTNEVSHEVTQTKAQQSSDTEDEPVLQAKLEFELQKQKQLYNTLLKKTSQLHQIQQVNSNILYYNKLLRYVTIYNVIILLGYREIKSWLRSRKVMPQL